MGKQERAPSVDGKVLVRDQMRGPSQIWSSPPDYAVIAQMVERLICNQDVRGSNPRGGTIFIPISSAFEC